MDVLYFWIWKCCESAYFIVVSVVLKQQTCCPGDLASQLLEEWTSK